MAVVLASMGDVTVGHVVTRWVRRGRGLALCIVYIGANIGAVITVLFCGLAAIAALARHVTSATLVIIENVRVMSGSLPYLSYHKFQFMIMLAYQILHIYCDLMSQKCFTPFNLS